jgi:hypothetical protein
VARKDTEDGGKTRSEKFWHSEQLYGTQMSMKNETILEVAQASRIACRPWEGLHGTQARRKSVAPNPLLKPYIYMWIYLIHNLNKISLSSKNINEYRWKTKNNKSLVRTLGSGVRIPLEAWVSVWVYSVFVVLFVGSGLATGWSPVKGVLPTVYTVKLSLCLIN